MPTIEITEDQYDRLEDVRAELEAHRLGPYGTIRAVDAVEFLLDHYETGAELIEDETAGGQDVATPDIGGGEETTERNEEDETDGDRADEKENEDDEEGEIENDEDEQERDDEDEQERDDEDEQEKDDEDEQEKNEEGAAEEGDGKDETAEGDGEAGEDGKAEDGEREDDEAEGEDENDGGGNGSAGRLDAMMQLLEEHDDKWDESDSEDGKYAVTLPDETTEQVRTKDDVRALLFKHY